VGLNFSRHSTFNEDPRCGCNQHSVKTSCQILKNIEGLELGVWKHEVYRDCTAVDVFRNSELPADVNRSVEPQTIDL
jgi:hypothetical protein